MHSSLLENVTSSTKLEVHNVSQRQDTTTGDIHKNLVKISHMDPEISMWTDKQTDVLITILCFDMGRSNNHDNDYQNLDIEKLLI